LSIQSGQQRCLYTAAQAKIQTNAWRGVLGEEKSKFDAMGYDLLNGIVLYRNN